MCQLLEDGPIAPHRQDDVTKAGKEGEMAWTVISLKRITNVRIPIAGSFLTTWIATSCIQGTPCTVDLSLSVLSCSIMHALGDTTRVNEKLVFEQMFVLFKWLLYCSHGRMSHGSTPSTCPSNYHCPLQRALYLHLHSGSHFRRVPKIAQSDYELRHVCPSAWNTSAPTGRSFMKFDIWGFFENLSRKFKFN